MEENSTNTSEQHSSKSERSGKAIAKAIIDATDPLDNPRLTSYEIAEMLETTPDSIRDTLTDFTWSHQVGDDGVEWAFDRHVVFSDSIEDVVESYPERYEKGDFDVQ